MCRALIAFFALAALALPRVASAHIHLVSPAVRYDEQKTGPCGRSGGGRGTKITTVEAGSVLRVQWTEPVNHPSHFRVSFDVDGDDDFVDPKGYDDRNTNETVLVDGISDASGSPFSIDVKLPDVTCERCTLQLVQVMYDKGPYAPGTNDLYYQCADLVLTRGAPAPDAGSPATPDPDPVDAGSPVASPAQGTPSEGEMETSRNGASAGHEASGAGESEAMSGGSGSCSPLRGASRGGPLGALAWPLSALLWLRRRREPR